MSNLFFNAPHGIRDDKQAAKAVVLCAGYTPTGTGADIAEVPMPYRDNGTGIMIWYLSNIQLRVQSPGGSPSIIIQKSTGNSIFSGVDMGGVTLEPGAYEGHSSSTTGTISSSDKMRFYINDIGTAENWTVVAEISNYGE